MDQNSGEYLESVSDGEWEEMMDVSICIITWNAKEKLRECLKSLSNGTFCSHEIIVVDNCSNDGTIDMLRSEFRDVTLIRNESNKGVSKARNQAMRLARGEYILLLDDDTLISNGAIDELHRFMESYPDAGLVGPKLLYADGSLQLSCRRFPSPVIPILRRTNFTNRTSKLRIMQDYLMANWDHSDSRPVDYVIGACQMIRKSVLQQVGFLDENMFYGPEDIDFCLRMWLNGWKVYYNPSSEVIHYEQRKTKNNPLSILCYRHLHALYHFFYKHRPSLIKRVRKTVRTYQKETHSKTRFPLHLNI